MKMSTLIIGGSGTLGKELHKKYNNIITYNKNFIADGVKFDALNMSLEKTIKNLNKFDNAILLLAEKNPNKCFEKKKYYTIFFKLII